MIPGNPIHSFRGFAGIKITTTVLGNDPDTRALRQEGIHGSSAPQLRKSSLHSPRAGASENLCTTAHWEFELVLPDLPTPQIPGLVLPVHWRVSQPVGLARLDTSGIKAFCWYLAQNRQAKPSQQ
ncbi:hypothetical protein AFLA70_410g000841 [Aspergillus flavus AF70]|nr:hypothetical protein AFLA70_410g000841 [Aspergillus flavus AF70]